MTTNHKKYIPAFSYGFLTPLYDLIMRLTIRELAFKRRLIEQARTEKGSKILDLGCGTGTLILLIKKTYPEAEVVGLDGDLKVLEIARSKAKKTGLSISLDHGMAFELPYPDGFFDRVVSSLVFHHLTQENKVRTLREVLRILRPEGELHIADLGKPQNILMRLPTLLLGRLEEASDNVKGLLPEMIKNAGFSCVEETCKYMTIFGTIALYAARKP